MSSKLLAGAWPEIITSFEGAAALQKTFFFSPLRLIRPLSWSVAPCASLLLKHHRGGKLRTQVVAAHPSLDTATARGSFLIHERSQPTWEECEGSASISTNSPKQMKCRGRVAPTRLAPITRRWSGACLRPSDHSRGRRRCVLRQFSGEARACVKVWINTSAQSSPRLTDVQTARRAPPSVQYHSPKCNYPSNQLLHHICFSSAPSLSGSPFPSAKKQKTRWNLAMKR